MSATALPARSDRLTAADAVYGALGAVLIVGLVAVGRLVGLYWNNKHEATDRLVILAASAWLVYRVRERFRAVPACPSWLGLLPLGLACLAFPLGWYLITLVGAKKILLWWVMLSLLSATAGLVACRWGWRRLSVLLIPLAFSLFALPIPDSLYNPLQHYLKEATTTLTAGILPLLGIPVKRLGYVLNLPTADLGVAEACSGVRSMTALLAVAALVAYLRGLSWLKSLALIVLAIPIIILSNVTRVVLTGVLQETLGRWAIEDTAHEILGTSVVLVGLGLILAVAQLFPHKQADPLPPPPPEPAPPPIPVLWPALLVVPALLLCLFAEGRRIETPEVVQLDSLPFKLGAWEGRDIPIDPKIEEMLTFDKGLRRLYRSPFGEEVHLWVMYWATSARTFESAEIHHPDICWPTRGFHIDRRSERQVDSAELGRPITASVSHYSQGDRHQVVLYWSQEGSAVLEEDERHGGDRLGHGWIGSLLQLGGAPRPRLSVMIGSDSYGSVGSTEKTLAELARLFADSFYRQNPWARPEGDSPSSSQKVHGRISEHD
jgi:EpsI family protein